MVTVDDNGIGIPASERDRAFAMFSRLGTHGRYDGTGIGLAICKRVWSGRAGLGRRKPGRRRNRFCFTISRGAPR